MLACTSIPSAPVSSTLQALSVSKGHKTSVHGSSFFELRTGRLATNRFLRVLLMLPEGGLRV